MSAPLSRRAFLARGAGAAAALAGAPLLGACSAAAPEAQEAPPPPPATLAAWVLDPEWGGCGHAAADRNCHACAACHAHARNKLFATREAADVNRAHPRCRCLVAEMALPAEQWAALFGPPDGVTRVAVDRRWELVREILG
jgi:hypothetical protein